MTTTALNETLTELDALLDEERLALLGGELIRLSELMRAKETLIETLNTAAQLKPGDMDPIRSKVRRNQELFDHALAGVKSVTDRLSTLRHLRHALDTYTVNGTRRHVISSQDRKLEKRA